MCAVRGVVCLVVSADGLPLLSLANHESTLDVAWEFLCDHMDRIVIRRHVHSCTVVHQYSRRSVYVLALHGAGHSLVDTCFYTKRTPRRKCSTTVTRSFGGREPFEGIRMDRRNEKVRNTMWTTQTDRHTKQSVELRLQVHEVSDKDSQWMGASNQSAKSVWRTISATLLSTDGNGVKKPPQLALKKHSFSLRKKKIAQEQNNTIFTGTPSCFVRDQPDSRLLTSSMSLGVTVP